MIAITSSSSSSFFLIGILLPIGTICQSSHFKQGRFYFYSLDVEVTEGCALTVHTWQIYVVELSFVDPSKRGCSALSFRSCRVYPRGAGIRQVCVRTGHTWCRWSCLPSPFDKHLRCGWANKKKCGRIWISLFPSTTQPQIQTTTQPPARPPQHHHNCTTTPPPHHHSTTPPQPQLQHHNPPQNDRTAIDIAKGGL